MTLPPALPLPLPALHVALLDHHQPFRRGLRHLLQALPYVAHIMEAGGYAELLAHCRQRQPNLLLLGLPLPGLDGAKAARQLLQGFPDLKIIVLSALSADALITQMMRIGVRSYLPKETDQHQLRQAIEDVVTTGHHFTPAISRALMWGIQRPVRAAAPRLAPTAQLTPREHEVLLLICEGRTAAEIAGQLCISRRTVEGHRQKLLEKTGAPNSAGLVVYAVRHGLLPAWG